MSTATELTMADTLGRVIACELCNLSLPQFPPWIPRKPLVCGPSVMPNVFPACCLGCKLASSRNPTLRQHPVDPSNLNLEAFLKRHSHGRGPQFGSNYQPRVNRTTQMARIRQWEMTLSWGRTRTPSLDCPTEWRSMVLMSNKRL